MKRTRLVATLSITAALTLAYAIPATLAAKVTPPGNIPSGCAGGTYPDWRAGSPDQLQVVNHNQRDWLRVATRIANTGTGDLRLRADPPPLSPTSTPITNGFQQITVQPANVDSTPTIVCEVLVSQFEYHPTHKHWHLADVARYSVHRALDAGQGGSYQASVVSNGAGLALSVKNTFCLIDVQSLDSRSWSEQKGSFYLFCEDEFQGLSPRWSDTYKGELDGQEVDVTGLGDGIYYVVAEVNYLDTYLDANLTNNVAWRSFQLSHDATGNPQLRVISGNNCDEPVLCAGNKGWNR